MVPNLPKRNSFVKVTVLGKYSVSKGASKII